MCAQCLLNTPDGAPEQVRVLYEQARTQLRRRLLRLVEALPGARVVQGGQGRGAGHIQVLMFVTGEGGSGAWGVDVGAGGCAGQQCA